MGEPNLRVLNTMITYVLKTTKGAQVLLILVFKIWLLDSSTMSMEHLQPVELLDWLLIFIILLFISFLNSKLLKEQELV